jgi:hypothetical protein
MLHGDNTGAQQLRYQGATLPVVQEIKNLGMWMDKDMSVPLAIGRARGCMMAAWRDLVTIALNAGVRDLLHAMTVLLETHVIQKAMCASQVLGPDVLHLSPCGKLILLSELAAIFKRVLSVNDVVLMPCLMDEFSIKPLQVHRFKDA